MSQGNDKFKKVISHCKEYGFIFQSSEIYEGISALYDYGPNGVLLKNNLKNYWWKEMVQLRGNIVGLDSSILMHPTVWKASGHVDAFNDPMLDNKDSKKRYRADVLIEDYAEKFEAKIQKEIKKAQKRFGEEFDEKTFVDTNERVLSYKKQKEEVLDKLNRALENENLEAIDELIQDLGISDPDTGSKNWTKVRQFNLMFGTKVGASSEKESSIYLRPETAQGIFVNFLNVMKTSRQKVPFGIAQIGKAFRNEIIARQFIFRMREFEQMEMQFFVSPGSEIKWYEYWREERLKWHNKLGLGESNYRFHDHDKLAHYANAASDIEFNFPFGFKELEGIHSRTDFDLKKHSEFSGKKMQYFDNEKGESYTPYVVETSIGLDRLFLAVLCNSLIDEELPDNKGTRLLMKIPYFLAPTQLAILPLVNKEGLPEIANEMYGKLVDKYFATIDSKDSIGRRYRRQDAVGTPFCITIDHQTKSDGTFTIRDRNSMKQKRCDMNNFEQIIEEFK